MSWVKIEPPIKAGAKPSQITVRLNVPKKRGQPYVMLTIPSSLLTMVDIPDSAERVNVHAGQDANAGQFWVEPHGAGDFKITRLAKCANIRMPIPEGVAVRDQIASVDYERVPGMMGFIIPRPDFLDPAHKPKAVALPPAPKGPSLICVEGNNLHCAGLVLTLQPIEALLMEKMIAAMGREVTNLTLTETAQKVNKSLAVQDVLRIMAQVRNRLKSSAGVLPYRLAATASAWKLEPVKELALA